MSGCGRSSERSEGRLWTLSLKSCKQSRSLRGSEDRSRSSGGGGEGSKGNIKHRRMTHADKRSPGATGLRESITGAARLLSLPGTADASLLYPPTDSVSNGCFRFSGLSRLDSCVLCTARSCLKQAVSTCFGLTLWPSCMGDICLVHLACCSWCYLPLVQHISSFACSLETFVFQLLMQAPSEW